MFIRLEEYTLFVTGATYCTVASCRAVRLFEVIQKTPGGFFLGVTTESGKLSIEVIQVRLVRNGKMAILIPPVDV